MKDNNTKVEEGVALLLCETLDSFTDLPKKQKTVVDCSSDNLFKTLELSILFLNRRDR